MTKTRREFLKTSAFAGAATLAWHDFSGAHTLSTSPLLPTESSSLKPFTALVILVSGRPLLIEPVLSKCRAFIAAWLPGTEGQGIADVLFGDYRPTGRLSMSFPRSMQDALSNAGDKNYAPLFKYGYGLRY